MKYKRGERREKRELKKVEEREDLHFDLLREREREIGEEK